LLLIILLQVNVKRNLSARLDVKGRKIKLTARRWKVKLAVNSQQERSKQVKGLNGRLYFQ
jgi:hypothetical protein